MPASHTRPLGPGGKSKFKWIAHGGVRAIDVNFLVDNESNLL
jgi:hypothetical protein